MGKKDKIPPPGNKKDPYTNFMKKAKWTQTLRSQVLDIQGNAIQKEGAVIVANILNKNMFVEKLVITQTHLGDAGITEFAQMLKLNVTIRSIHFGVNDITDIGGVMLASAFLINRTVSHVYAPGNTFGDDTAAAWAFVLRSNFEVKHLDLSWNIIGYRGAEALSQTFKKNNGFTLDLGQNRLGDEGCRYLAEATMQAGNELHHTFNVWQNDIGKDGGLAVAEMVEKNMNLTQLNLSWNSCGSCVGPLAKAMAVNQGCGAFVPRPEDELKKEAAALVEDGFRKVEDYKYSKGQETKIIIRQIWHQTPDLPACGVVNLNLSQCLVGDLGCDELGKLFAANGYLRYINLSWNNIGAPGMIAMCEGLMNSQSLIVLNLAHNKITDEAAPALSKFISSTTSLEGLYLQRNEMTDKGKGIVSVAIPKQGKIKVNYGALDDMIPLTGVYSAAVSMDQIDGGRKDSRSARGRKSSMLSVNSGGGDGSTARGSARRKSRSRSTVSAAGSNAGDAPASP